MTAARLPAEALDPGGIASDCCGLDSDDSLAFAYYTREPQETLSIVL